MNRLWACRDLSLMMRPSTKISLKVPVNGEPFDQGSQEWHYYVRTMDKSKGRHTHAWHFQKQNGFM